MQFVDYGKTGLKVSRFGLGCMRYPSNTPEAIKMIRYALDNDVNYLDTAYIYGDSERVTGLALKDGYRNKAIVVTKNPSWNIHKYTDFETYLDEELKRLGTDYIDVYLHHNMNYENWAIVKKYDGLTFMDKMLEKGKIRHKAFSFHGTTALFKEVADAFDWEMAQIQLNILDECTQAGVEGLKYASGKGMAVVVMEPLRGGHILSDAPAEVKRLIDRYPEKRSLLEWSFRYLYDMPEVTVVISGTSTIEQLRQNIAICNNSGYNVLSGEDREFIKQIREAFEGKKSVGCTGCRYCIPCPENVDIPEIFKLYNSMNLMKTHWVDKEMYTSNLVSAGTGADRCTNCGACMKHCPQGLNIPERLKEAHRGLKT